MVTAKLMSAIKLEDAYFCLNCEVVTTSRGNCLVCGNTQLWPLENWIGRVDHGNNRYRQENATEALPSPTSKLAQKVNQLKWWTQHSRVPIE